MKVKVKQLNTCSKDGVTDFYEGPLHRKVIDAMNTTPYLVSPLSPGPRVLIPGPGDPPSPVGVSRGTNLSCLYSLVSRYSLQLPRPVTQASVARDHVINRVVMIT